MLLEYPSPCWSPSLNCLLQSCCNGVVLPTCSALVLPCLHDYLAIMNFQHLVAGAASCFTTCHPAISRSGKRGHHGAWCPNIPVDSKRECPTWTISLRMKFSRYRNPAVFNWRQLCALNTSKGTVRPVGHARVTGCETFTAIVKEFCSVKGWKASAIIACEPQTLPKKWQATVGNCICSRPSRVL